MSEQIVCDGCGKTGIVPLLTLHKEEVSFTEYGTEHYCNWQCLADRAAKAAGRRA